MTDPLRLDRPATSDDVPEHDREARVEDLLLAGLDHYFVGQYELAINVWTRVLFIDRGHARARAYIERARGALAERQREAEELLHSGAAAFDRGDAHAARQLLTSAVERGAGNEEALALLDRLDRLGPAQPHREPPALPPLRARIEGHHVAVPAAAEERSWLAWVAAGIIAGLLLAGMSVALLLARGELSGPDRQMTVAAPYSSAADALPVPGAGDVWLARARALHAKGRLHEALNALGAVRMGDPRRPEADELRATIQRALLEAARSPVASAPPADSSATTPAGAPTRR